MDVARRNACVGFVREVVHIHQYKVTRAEVHVSTSSVIDTNSRGDYFPPSFIPTPRGIVGGRRPLMRKPRGASLKTVTLICHQFWRKYLSDTIETKKNPSSAPCSTVSICLFPSKLA